MFSHLPTKVSRNCRRIKSVRKTKKPGRGFKKRQGSTQTATTFQGQKTFHMTGVKTGLKPAFNGLVIANLIKLLLRHNNPSIFLRKSILNVFPKEISLARSVLQTRLILIHTVLSVLHN